MQVNMLLHIIKEYLSSFLLLKKNTLTLWNIWSCYKIEKHLYIYKEEKYKPKNLFVYFYTWQTPITSTIGIYVLKNRHFRFTIIFVTKFHSHIPTYTTNTLQIQPNDSQHKVWRPIANRAKTKYKYLHVYIYINIKYELCS